MLEWELFRYSLRGTHSRLCLYSNGFECQKEMSPRHHLLPELLRPCIRTSRQCSRVFSRYSILPLHMRRECLLRYQLRFYRRASLGMSRGAKACRYRGPGQWFLNLYFQTRLNYKCSDYFDTNRYNHKSRLLQCFFRSRKKHCWQPGCLMQTSNIGWSDILQCLRLAGHGIFRHKNYSTPLYSTSVDSPRPSDKIPCWTG